MKKQALFLIITFVVIVTALQGCSKNENPVSEPSLPPDQYLPLGSVVQLEGTTVKLVIVGYAPTQLDTEEITLWDYSGAKYPEGILSPEELYLFNHNMITEVVFLGYHDQEYTDFLPLVEQALENKQ